ncbi:MAG: hypothetical protein ACKVPJ_04025 [Chitinophagales bacterium]
MTKRSLRALEAATRVCVKIIFTVILLGLVVFSVKAETPVRKEFSVLHPIDTGLKKTDPSLIYKKQDYYFDLQPYTANGISIKDFLFILTFDVGVTMKQEIRQIAFRDADMSFSLKFGSSSPYAQQKFSKHTQTFSEKDRKILITFIPDKSSSTNSASKSSATKNSITKCEFSGVVKNNGAEGTFTFYFTNGENIPVLFNAMAF